MGDFETGLAVGMLFGKRGTTPTPTPSTKNEILEMLDATDTLASILLPDGWSIRIKYNYELDSTYNSYTDYTCSDMLQTTCEILIWFCFYKNNEIRFATYYQTGYRRWVKYGTSGELTTYYVNDGVVENFVITSVNAMKFDYAFPVELTSYNSSGEITDQRIYTTYTESGASCRTQIYSSYTAKVIYDNLENFYNDYRDTRIAVNKYLGLI